MRVIVGLALIIVSELTILALGHSLSPGRAVPPRHSLESFPTVLGAWIGEEMEVDQRLFNALGGESMINRVYQNAAGERVTLNLTLWLDYLPQFPHPPEVCYPSAGWETVGRHVIEIPAQSGQQFNARSATFERHGTKVVVVCWTKLGSSVAVTDNDVRQVLQQSRGFRRNRPAAIKIMLEADATDPTEAERQIVEFASLLPSQLERFEQ